MYYGVSDLELVKMVLSGNTGNFIWLVRRYQAMVITLLNKRFSRDIIEELAQEVFIDAFQELESFNKNESFPEWLLVITLRRCHKYRCKIYTPKENKVTLEAVEHKCLETIVNTEYFSDLSFSNGVNDLRNKILNQLSPEDQLLIEGIYFENYSIKTMARVLKCNRLTLKLKTANARRKMRKIISESFASGNISNEFNAVRTYGI